ncbi:MAG TPA: DUF924 family protein [Devosia sp.]|nr:DUF924 family protein [Devosia sp.]
MRSPADVIAFWFEQHNADDWFGGKSEFDAELAREFAQTHLHVAKGEAYSWRTSAEGRLAEIIVLDQFSRQLHRGSPEAFAQDKMALVLAQEAVGQGLDLTVDPVRRPFFYLPYMHSESLLIHDEAMRLYAALGEPEQLDYEVKHRAAIERFGRFPFRNKALGRQSTPEELAYMEAAGTRAF